MTQLDLIPQPELKHQTEMFLWPSWVVFALV